MMAQKILFLHGFFASGACVPALALKDYFNGKATVLTPDLPLYPREALDFIRKLCEQEKPDKGRRIPGLDRGIGMHVLADVAQKYNGSISFNENKRIFTTELIIGIGV